MYSLFLKRAICIFLTLALCMAASAGNGLGLKTVVIDPGHGGKDPGAVSKDKKTYEKTLVLDISKRLADKITAEYPDVSVIMTRSTDRTLTLDQRASTANDADADLFISIHVNSSTSTSPNGYSVHVLGQSSNKNRDLFAYNMDVCRAENSVVMLEDDYSTKYQEFDPSDPESFIFMQLMQSAYLEQSLLFAQFISDNLSGGPIKSGRGIWQDPFYVLWKTSMPAVLVELGFISNQQDIGQLKQETSREALAEALFNSFVEYKTQYDKSLDFAVEPSSVPVAESDSTAKVDKVMYGTQIFASGKLLKDNDSRFLGYKPEVISGVSIYKYVIGVSYDPEEAKKSFGEISKKYPSAFLVKIENGKSVQIR